MARRRTLLPVVVLCCACSGQTLNAHDVDAGAVGEAPLDGGRVEASASDGATGPLDGGRIDAGVSDGGIGQLGSGSAIGTYDSGTFLWVPGVDEFGTVNAGSLNLVPRNTWVQVASTSFDTLTAETRAMAPSWTADQLGWVNLFSSWGSFAQDPQHNRAWFFGGGHSDGYNNGLYRFDALRMRWAVEHPPSDRSQWSSAYLMNGGATTCPESASAAATNPCPPGQSGSWFYDELFWDHRPTARHVYDGMVYASDTDEILMGSRRMWRYSLAKHEWTARVMYTGQIDSENVGLVYDENEGRAYVSATGSAVLRKHYVVDTHAAVEVGPWSPFWPSNRQANALSRVGRFAVSINPPERPVTYSNNGIYNKYSLDSKSVVESGELQFADGMTLNDFGSGTDTAAQVFVPPLSRYWMVTTLSDSAFHLMEVDPTTTPWTMRRTVHAGLSPVMPNDATHVLCQRVQWMPGLNAVILHRRGDENVLMYRF